MTSVFKSVALISKHKKPGVIETLNALIDFLHQKNIKVILEEETALLTTQQLPSYPRDLLASHSDLLIVIGGDGSILDAASLAVAAQVPILGVNRGKLGFLTDIPPSNINKIGPILHGCYIKESRHLLQAVIPQQAKNVQALNEIVLISNIAAHLIEFSLYLNDEFVCNYRADGLIITTPTGSTAHALSASGPILQPGLGAIALVPMLSHNLSSRPLVVRHDNKIKIVTLTTNVEQLCLICDGKNKVSLTPGESIVITIAPEMLQLLHPVDYNYFETLRVKLNWERY